MPNPPVVVDKERGREGGSGSGWLRRAEGWDGDTRVGEKRPRELLERRYGIMIPFTS